MLPQYTLMITDPEERLRLGWWAIYIIGGMITVNLVIVLTIIIRSAILKQKRKGIIKQKKKEFDKEQIT
jgi:hypothetical protein